MRRTEAWRSMQPAFGTSPKCDTRVPFNSRNIYFKNPFGGVETRRTVRFLFPVAEYMNPDRVTLYLRRNDHTVPYPMIYSGKRDGYVNYEADFSLERDGTYYYRFEILHTDGGITYVGKGEGGYAVCGEWLPEWQLTVYEKDYKTPDSFKGGVVYHIFVDRFRNLDNKEKPRYGVLKDWSEDVTVKDLDGVYRANDFYGGNFKGIISELDYLAELGVTDLYLSPIFESSSNHRYDTGDYLKIDPMLGTEEDFRLLIKKAAEKGMGIILDGVFNHTGADSLYFNKFNHYDSVGAYQSKDSPYYDWFTFFDFPDDYLCWWGVTVVPTVARDAKGFHKLIAGEGGVIRKWTDMGVRGWRLDVVDELSGTFVKALRVAVKKNDPENVVIGEVWEDASNKYSYGEEREYFRGNELDGVMNYVFKKAILGFLTHEFDAETFAEKVMTIIENYPKCSLDTCLTLIGSHDTVRAINALSGADGGADKEARKNYRLTPEEYETGKKRLILASCLQYFLPGVPSVYYGDETGMQGFEDPINRRPFPKAEERDEEILAHYRYLGKFRKENRKAFTEQAFVFGKGEEVIIERESLRLRLNRSFGSFLIEKK